MDMVFTTCTRVSSNGVGTDCYVNIAYNQQLGLCSSTTDSGIKNGARVCRPPNDLCTADDNFQFNLQDGPDNEVNTIPLHIWHVRLTYNLSRLSSASLFHPSFPTTPRSSWRIPRMTRPYPSLYDLEMPTWMAIPTFWP